MTERHILTWQEAKRAIEEGGGPETATLFAEAMETISSHQALTKRAKQAKEYLNGVIGEWIGDAQFMDQDGVIYEMAQGMTASLSEERLLAAGVTQAQIDQAKKRTAWQSVMVAKR